MAKGERYKVLVVKSKDWLKAQKNAEEKSLVDLLSKSSSVKFIYINKDAKHPEKWGIAAIIDVGDPNVKDILDEVARKLGYAEGVLSRQFLNKYVKENCLRKMASY